MFHLREGFFFERTADGDVRIVYAPERGKVVADITVPPNEWASVVSTVSAHGENYATWRAAECFQNGSLFEMLALWRDAPSNTASAAVPGTCRQPPEGWFCTLEAGHEGSCPTWPEDGCGCQCGDGGCACGKG